jgi:hypothetical protein
LTYKVFHQRRIHLRYSNNIRNGTLSSNDTTKVIWVLLSLLLLKKDNTKFAQQLILSTLFDDDS